MITRLKVTNFKSLRELECEFGRFTVIVGPNGCGKSSVLQAIEAVRNTCQGTVSRTTWPISRTVDGDAPNSYIFELVFNASVTVEGKIEQDDLGKWLSGSQRFARLQPDAEPLPIYEEGGWSVVAGLLNRIYRYQLDKTILERSTFSHESKPTLGYRGEDLASVLDAMQGERREQFEAIEAGLRKFVPGLRRVRLQRVQHPHQTNLLGHQVVLDFEYARHIVADQASEGTILLLGLLTVIGTESGSPITVMLDDLDRGLHPKAQEQLIAHLHTLLGQRPDLQIIATTHSPYLVEHLEYEEVLAMTHSPVDGRSLIAPLAKHPDADRWRDEMSAGEFWSSVGEAWIAGDR